MPIVWRRWAGTRIAEKLNPLGESLAAIDKTIDCGSANSQMQRNSMSCNPATAT